jgi:predicted MFS family arabinose efflux permease
MAIDMRRVAIACAGASVFVNLYSPQAILPLLAQEFGVGAADISLAITATTLAIAMTAPFTGAIADVLGRRRVIITAMIVLLIPSVMVAFAPSLHALVFWRFLQGLVMPAIFTVTIAYIGEEWSPREATGVTGIYTSATGFGGFAGRVFPGVLADAVGWRGGLLASAAMTLFCLVVVVALLPPERKFVRAVSLRASARQMVAHVKNPKLLAVYAVGFGVLFNFIALFTYVSFLLAGPPYNLSATFLGLIFLVYLTGTIVTPFTGRAVGRFGRRNFIVVVIAIWACGIALTLVPSLIAIIAGLAIAAACGFLCQASSTSLVAITAQQGASSAVGLYVTAFYLGGSVGATLGGIAWTFAAWPGIVAIILAMLTIIATIVATSWDAAPARV